MAQVRKSKVRSKGQTGREGSRRRDCEIFCLKLHHISLLFLYHKQFQVKKRKLNKIAELVQELGKMCLCIYKNRNAREKINLTLIIICIL